MSRKRSITSEMSTDERLAEVAEQDQNAALMWPWFITGLDDWGRMTASPMKIKLDIFPAFQFTAQDVEKAIQLYDKYGLIHVYSVNGKNYLAVDPNKYFKYQAYIATKKRYVDGSNIPAPPNPPWEYKYLTESEYRLRLAMSSEGQLGLAEPSQVHTLSDPSPSPSPSKDLKRSSSQPDGATAPDSPEPDCDQEVPENPRHPVPKRGEKVFSEDTKEFQLAHLLRSEIIKNLPEARVPRASPDGLANWCLEINRMIHFDKRDPRDIALIIKWSQTDHFWRSNILSAKKLREKWETLVLQSKRPLNQKKGENTGEKHDAAVVMQLEKPGKYSSLIPTYGNTS